MLPVLVTPSLGWRPRANVLPVLVTLEEATRCWRCRGVRGRGGMLVGVLDLLCDAPVLALLLLGQPRLARVGLAHRLDDAGPALLTVGASRLRLTVPEDVLALRAGLLVAELLQVGLVDPQAPGLCWPHLVRRGPLCLSWLVKSNSCSLLPCVERHRSLLNPRQGVRTPSVSLRTSRH